MNIFISYSHQDSNYAQLLRELLQEKHITVTIDSSNMIPGTRITEFITNSINNTDATISIVSRNSLLSTWVAMESIKGFRSSKKLIPCYIDESFLQRNFTGVAGQKISEEIKDIQNAIAAAHKNGMGIIHLENELERYQTLLIDLPEILAEFKKIRCVDIAKLPKNRDISQILRALNVLCLAEEEMEQWWQALSLEWKTIFTLNFPEKIIPTHHQLEKLFIIQGIDCHEVQIDDLQPLSIFQNLKWLICNKTLVNSLEPLKNLVQLEFLDCSNSFIRSLTPLIGLSTLKNLICINTKLSNDDILKFLQLQQNCRVQYC